MLTLAFSQIAFEIAYKWTDLTGGENGLQGVPRPWLVSDWSFHVFTVLTVTGGMWLLWRIAHAPFGRALQALRDNEQRMQSLGYSTFRLKFEAFVILGGVVGYAGALLALMLRGAYADNLGWQHAGDALLMTVLGGVHQFLGPLWGAIAFTLLAGSAERDHRKLVADVRADHHPVRPAVAGRDPRRGAASAATRTALDAGAFRHSTAPRSHRAVS